MDDPKSVHEGNIKNHHECEFCGKTYTSGQYLQNHIFVFHEGCKDYNCKFCGNLFSNAHHLKRHIHTIHEGNKDYKCESCGKSISNSIRSKIIQM